MCIICFIKWFQKSERSLVKTNARSRHSSILHKGSIWPFYKWFYIQSQICLVYQPSWWHGWASPASWHRTSVRPGRGPALPGPPSPWLRPACCRLARSAAPLSASPAGSDRTSNENVWLHTLSQLRTRGALTQFTDGPPRTWRGRSLYEVNDGSGFSMEKLILGQHPTGDNSPPDKNKARLMPTRTTIHITIPH